MYRCRWKPFNLLLGSSLAFAMSLAGPLHAGGPAPQASAATAAPASGTAYDYFTTVATRTAFEFIDDFALPAGFFDAGSARFAGRVAFKGVPLGTFEGRDVGNADTVVARTGTSQLGSSYPSRGTAEVEVVALNLASSQPLRIKVGKKTQLWDATLQLSSHRPPRGKMTIVQKSAKGGTFDSDFQVFPLITFVRRGDGAKRTLDVGTLKLGPAATRRVTLKGRSLPWATQAPQRTIASTDTFHAGITESGNVEVMMHIASAHSIEAARAPNAN
jgi:hypothetical protein